MNLSHTIDISTIASTVEQNRIAVSKRVFYWEYNPDSTGTRRDECLVGDSRRQVLVDGNKELKWFKYKQGSLGVNQ